MPRPFWPATRSCAVTRWDGMLVLPAEPEFKIARARTAFAGDDTDFNATPAISDGELFLRSNLALYCVAARKVRLRATSRGFACFGETSCVARFGWSVCSVLWARRPSSRSLPEGPPRGGDDNEPRALPPPTRGAGGRRTWRARPQSADGSSRHES